MVQETSIEAYEEVLENLGERQRMVYEALRKLGEADNLSISLSLGIPINSVTPRVLELRNKKLVGVGKVDLSPITGRKVIFWRCVR